MKKGIPYLLAGLAAGIALCIFTALRIPIPDRDDIRWGRC